MNALLAPQPFAQRSVSDRLALVRQADSAGISQRVNHRPAQMVLIAHDFDKSTALSPKPGNTFVESNGSLHPPRQ